MRDIIYIEIIMFSELLDSLNKYITNIIYMYKYKIIKILKYV